MRKITNFIKLDFITIKPYITLKNIGFYLLIAFMVEMSSNNYVSIISMVIVFTYMYAAYPFAVGEQEGLNSLYSILKLDRNDVVKGRYLFLVSLNIIGVVIGILLYLGVVLMTDQAIVLKEVLLVVFMTSLIANVNYLIQYPLLFKNGYLKSATLIFLPMMIIVAIGMVFYYSLKDLSLTIINLIMGFVLGNVVLSIILTILIWLLFLYLSYRISLEIYTSRYLQ